MKRSSVTPLPKYFDRYINLVEDIDLVEALKKSYAALDELPIDIWNKLGDQVYAPGKWTVKDILQHILDAEKIFVYRALRFARKDQTQLHGFEEDDYAAAVDTSARNLQELIDELKTVRRATLYMFAAFDEATLRRVGSTSSTLEINVAALGFTIIGHEIHHLNVLRERYYSLVNK